MLLRHTLQHQTSHDADGNSWCHVDSCGGSYAAYRINIWELKSPEENQKKNCTMIAQQVTNIENHLAKAYVASFSDEAKVYGMLLC